MSESVRPTKKQQQLLVFIEKFIKEHGYSPSYREIMTGLSYKGVATVALHVNSLIQRGHLIKRGRSARSLELTEPTVVGKVSTNQIKASEEKWLVEKVDYYFKQAEKASSLPNSTLDNLYVLVGSLKVLGLDGAAQSFIPRLSALKSKAS